MPPKLTPLEKSLGSIMGIFYSIGRRLLIQKIPSSKKTLDIVDKKYLVRGGGLSPMVREAMTPEAKRAISVRLREGKTEAEIAESLITDNTFLNSVSNIFTPFYLGFFTRAPEQVEEEPAEEEPAPAPTPALASEMAERKRQQEEEEKRYDLYLKELQEEDRLQNEQRQLEQAMALSLERKAEETEKQEDRDSLERLSRIREMGAWSKPLLSNKLVSVRKAVDDAKKAEIKAEKKAKKTIDDAKKAKKAEDIASETRALLGDLKEQGIGILGRVEEVGAGVQAIQDTMLLIQADPQLSDIERKIRKELKDGKREIKASIIDNDALNQITSTIPERYRNLLGPAVRGLVGDDLKLNQVISGLVGVAVAVSSGSVIMGTATKSAIDRVFKAYNININDILTRPEEPPEPQAPAPQISATPAPQVALVGSIDTERPPPMFEQQFNQLLRVAEAISTGARRPTPEEVRTGAIVGGMAGALSGGLSSGSLMTGAGSAISGALMGSTASGLLSGQAEALSGLLERKLIANNINISPERKKQIKLIVQAIPPASLASFMMYNPDNEEPMGTGIITGGGITERKLIASPDVISQTQAQETQSGGSNKIWQPKTISPTTDILNESKQEKYADDVEFIAFNYIAPTSEGGYGTVETNPLKRSQATADALRFTDAGVYVPYLLWNQVNNTNDMKPQQLEKLALGVELPPMEFIAQDNEETFEEVALRQFPNNELMAIEFLSPYADFSNVENFWMTNPDNMLFTINK
jgi:hypothetical protein